MKYLYSLIFTFSTLLQAQSIVAHRGASYDAPQNTIPAFELAFKKGADFIEGDFHLTKDKRVVCFHDNETSKIADKKLIIKHSTWEELKRLDVGIKKGKKWQGLRMPLLEDVIEKVPPGKGIFIEIKSGIETVPYIQKIISASKLKSSQVYFISFKKEVLIKCKELMPSVKTLWLVSLKKKGGKVNYSAIQLLETVKKIKADAVGTSFLASEVTAENVKLLQDSGIEWNVWTVNKPEDGKLLKDTGVNFITTDRPLLIRKSLQ